jgi:uncharacterized protein with HEPN domain
MSEPRQFLDYLLDMQESLTDIRDFTHGMTFAAFAQDKKTINAVVRSLEVLGGAAGKIPSGVRERHPEMPWADMVGMRNTLTHEYFGVDLSIVWQTLADDLPPLEAAIDALILQYRKN